MTATARYVVQSIEKLVRIDTCKQVIEVRRVATGSAAAVPDGIREIRVILDVNIGIDGHPTTRRS